MALAVSAMAMEMSSVRSASDWRPRAMSEASRGLSTLMPAVTIVLNGLTKRADLVVHGREGRPLLLVECKAPHVRMDRKVFEQAARYNLVFRVPYLLVSNGLVHYCCRVDHVSGAVDFLPKVPAYAAMVGGDRT